MSRPARSISGFPRRPRRGDRGLSLPPALRPRAAFGDRDSRRAGRPILLPRGSARGHAQCPGARRHAGRLDGRARGQRRPASPCCACRSPSSATARRPLRASAIGRCRGRTVRATTSTTASSAIMSSTAAENWAATGQDRARLRRAPARRPRRQTCRSAMRSTGSRCSAATLSSSATAATKVSASPRSSCRAAPGSATSSGFPRRRKAKPAATLSSSGPTMPTAARA